MSGPSFFFKVQRAFDILLHTPMLPPPEAPPTVELTDVSTDVSTTTTSSYSSPSTSTFANPLSKTQSAQGKRPVLSVELEPAFPPAPHFPNYNSYSPASAKSVTSSRSTARSGDSSFELEAERAVEVRELVSAASKRGRVQLRKGARERGSEERGREGGRDEDDHENGNEKGGGGRV